MRILKPVYMVRDYWPTLLIILVANTLMASYIYMSLLLMNQDAVGNMLLVWIFMTVVAAILCELNLAEHLYRHIASESTNSYRDGDLGARQEILNKNIAYGYGIAAGSLLIIPFWWLGFLLVKTGGIN